MYSLDLDDPNVWDKWRELYSILTNEEWKEFFNRCEEKYPDQVHHDKSNYDKLFQRIPKNLYVLEMGGWKGELADYCFSKYKIEAWMNIDICSNAVNKSIPKRSNYIAICPGEFDWFNKRREGNWDVFVSAHTIEHFSDDHVKQILNYINGIKYVMLEAPIKEEENDWLGYEGTHILKMGWKEINKLMSNNGYLIQNISPECYFYVRL